MVKNWNTMSVESDVKETIEEFKSEYGMTNSEVLRYALNAMRDSKKLEAIMGVP